MGRYSSRANTFGTTSLAITPLRAYRFSIPSRVRASQLGADRWNHCRQRRLCGIIGVEPRGCAHVSLVIQLAQRELRDRSLRELPVCERFLTTGNPSFGVARDYRVWSHWGGLRAHYFAQFLNRRAYEASRLPADHMRWGDFGLPKSYKASAEQLFTNAHSNPAPDRPTRSRSPAVSCSANTGDNRISVARPGRATLTLTPR